MLVVAVGVQEQLNGVALVAVVVVVHIFKVGMEFPQPHQQDLAVAVLVSTVVGVVLVVDLLEEYLLDT
jgi:hypothetical protein